MSNEQYKPDSRLKNVENEADASAGKDAPKLVEVRKTDDSEDKDNEFVVFDKPSDEQITETSDKRDNYKDEEGD